MLIKEARVWVNGGDVGEDVRRCCWGVGARWRVRRAEASEKRQDREKKETYRSRGVTPSHALQQNLKEHDNKVVRMFFDVYRDGYEGY